jgi:serine/threonine-protein kinase
MNPEFHARLQEIFEAAIELPESERKAYLDGACGANTDLRRRIQKLIDAAEETATIDDPLEGPWRAEAEVGSCPNCGRCYESPISACPQDKSELEFEFQGGLLIHGKYLVERCLGRGGMGAVYLAKHLGLEKHFALKLMLTPYAGFETEARALGTLKHINIVDVTDYGVDPRGRGMPYLVMQYLEGATVSEVLKREGAIPFEKAVGLLRSVASAIDYAHEHSPSVIHGDLKPANLFLTSEKDHAQPTVKVVDFGLAKLGQAEILEPEAGVPTAAHGRSTPRADFRGTPAYMAPELFRGEEASQASDRYAFGVIVYEMLSLTLPFGCTIGDVWKNIQNPPVAPSLCNSELPAELDAPILALLSSNPADRPSSVSAGVSAMESAWLKAKQREWRAAEGPRRLVFAAMATALVLLSVGLLQKLPLGRTMEDATADWRWALVSKHRPDPRLLVVALDEETYDAQRQSLGSEWDGQFARMLNQLFDAGVRGVAIDITLPPTWSGSAPFRQAVISHASQIALGVRSESSGRVTGADCISPLTALAIGPAYDTLFSFVNIEEDETGTVRRGRLWFLDDQGRRRRSIAERAVDAAFPESSQFNSGRDWFWIDASVRPTDIRWIPWKNVTSELASAPDLFRGRLVIAGADFAEDQHRVPTFPNLLSGVLVQAMIANTILTGLPIRGADLLPWMAAAGVMCFAITAASLCYPHRYYRSALASLGLMCAYGALGIWILRSSRIIVPITGPEATIALGMAAGWGIKSRLRPYPVGPARG